MSMNEPKATNSSRAFHIIEGIILVVLGLGVMFVPRSLAVDILLGWVFLISGITGLITTLWVRECPGFFWSILSAGLGIVAGLLLLLSPRGVLSLTLILISFFIIEGVASIMYALGHKREMCGRWSWMMASGIIDLALAAAIVVGLPGSAQWALGLLVGINLIFGGVALIALVLHPRTEATE